jgi:SAM-dependent methyltransferase
VTPPAQWAYAISFKIPPEMAASTLAHRIRLDVEVTRGRIGVGCSNAAEDAFLLEKFSSDPQGIITLRVPAGMPAGSLILRNANATGASEFALSGIRIEPEAAAAAYPVNLPFREFSSEAVPPDGGTGTVFDTEGAAAINAARLAWLEQARLPFRRARVLDVGSGVGHFVPFYLAHDCTVVAVDGRHENIAELRRRHPEVDAYVADAQEIDTAYGAFDVIHCFGLLYHLESPVAALRRLAVICRRFMVIETMVCDSSQPIMVLADETRAASQALAGLGCRPSPSFLALALNRVGMPYVYGASNPPDHPDFQFSWRDNLDIVRGPHSLRSIFVASREPIDTPALTPLLD